MSQTKNPNDVTEKRIESSPLNFLEIVRKTPAKRLSEERKIDFKEIYPKAEKNQLANQASRCLDCGNPYCEWKCPLHNYIPNWLDLVAKDKLDDAAELMYQTNPLPEICGRVCPQDRLCEQACTINTGFGAVTIGAIEKNVTDRALAKKWRPSLPEIKPDAARVAIIGAGPAGIACADQLARNGIRAVVFDRYPEIGGLLTFGIPGFKLEKDVMRERKAFLEDIGVEFRLNTEVGVDVSFEKIQNDYDKVFLAMGTYQSVQTTLPGFDSGKLINALDYLIGNVNQQEQFGMVRYPEINLKGKTVVVLGGGDTAMDCVRTAIRQGADCVSCVYRRDEKSMPGSPREVQNAKEDGVQFIFSLAPVSLILDADSNVVSVTVTKTELTIDESTGNQRLEQKSGSEFELKADAVITAFGFKASPASWFDQAKIELNENGLVSMQPSVNCELNYSQRTSAIGIYAGGDMVRGADLVVTAIAEGIQAANEILEDLQPLP
jgi:glutamate synthase (NADPH/NADH) small chain